MSASSAACVASRAARASNSSFASVIANGKIRWPRRRTTSSAAHTLTEDGLPLINRSARTRSRGRTTGLMQLPDKPRTEASSPTDRRAGSLVFLELKRCELVGRTGFEPVTSSGSGKFRTVWVSVTVGLSSGGEPDPGEHSGRVGLGPETADGVGSHLCSHGFGLPVEQDRQGPWRGLATCPVFAANRLANLGSNIALPRRVQGRECEPAGGVARVLAAGRSVPGAGENGQQTLCRREGVERVGTSCRCGPIRYRMPPRSRPESARAGRYPPRAVICRPRPPKCAASGDPGPEWLATTSDRLCAHARQGLASARP